MNRQGANKREVFSAYLSKRGLSNTAERQAVLQQILASGSHFQADELYLKLAANKDRPISRATVYRTLSLLTDCGLIRKVAFIDRHSHYEHIFGHEHLICRKCRRIFEFQDRGLSEALNRICKDKGFERVSHKIEVVGLCEKCSRKKTDKTSRRRTRRKAARYDPSAARASSSLT